MTWIEIAREKIIFDPKVQTYCNNPRFKCPNYGHNWACPPEAPYLDNILTKYTYFFLVYEKFDLKAYISEKKSRFPNRSEEKIKNAFYREQFMRDWIEQDIKKFVENLERKYEEIFILWDGHCRVCEKVQKNCSYDEGIACRYPTDIRYSMEAVGINVTETVKNLNLDIEWPPKNYAYRFSLVCLK